MTTPTPTRPPHVFVAAYLFSGASALWLTAGLAAAFAIPEYAYHYADLEQQAAAGVTMGIKLGIAALAAAASALLALWLARRGIAGHPDAPSQLYLLCAVAVTVAAVLLLFDVFSAIRWHRQLMDSIAALTLILVVASVALLALPVSRAWFRLIHQAQKTQQARAELLAAAHEELLARALEEFNRRYAPAQQHWGPQYPYSWQQRRDPWPSRRPDPPASGPPFPPPSRR